MKTKNKKTKTMRRLALAAALLLILALLLAFDAINGDPLSQQWAIQGYSICGKAISGGNISLGPAHRRWWTVLPLCGIRSV